MYQSVLVHHAEAYRYRPGQEDTMLRVLSSASSDAGIYTVIHEPQAEPAVYEVQTAGAWTRLLACLHQVTAVLSLPARHRAAGSQGQAASAEAWGLLGEAQQ